MDRLGGPAGADAAARVTVVSVTHRSADAIAGFLDSLPPGLPLIIVDNASGDGTADRIASAAPRARIIRNSVNRGFGAGCNAGLDAARTEFVLLLNPDARLAPGAIETLVAAADAWPDAAILAPSITAEDGRRVRSWDVAQQRRRSLPRRRDTEPWPDGPVCVDFASGAAMLLRRAHALRFDESLFLFYEDDAICAQARARGLAVIHVPGARVAHAGGRSSVPSLRIRWRKAFHMALSRQIYRARHDSTDADARLAHHAGKALGHAITFRGAKLVDDLAGLAGTLAWLRRARTGP
jgi:GT2 family glycosyltransferase